MNVHSLFAALPLIEVRRAFASEPRAAHRLFAGQPTDTLKPGNDTFTYDKVSRLTQATIATGSATSQSQGYTYDAWGNMVTYGGQPRDVSGTTNRLSHASYDARGTSRGQCGGRDAGARAEAAFRGGWVGGGAVPSTVLRRCSRYQTGWIWDAGDQRYRYRFDWDPLDRMRWHNGPGINRVLACTADGERIVERDLAGAGWGARRGRERRGGFERGMGWRVGSAFDRAATVFPPLTNGVTTISLRGLDAKVLREVKLQSGAYSWQKDYIYREGQIGGAGCVNAPAAGRAGIRLAALAFAKRPRRRLQLRLRAFRSAALPSGAITALAFVGSRNRLLASHGHNEPLQHYHLDHLGTPRMLSNRCGERLQRFESFPFGEAIAELPQHPEKMRLTGHQRDLNQPTTTEDDLDYMHARYYGTRMARFLSVDPASDAETTKPQSWNTYAYVRGNPVKAIDPNGREMFVLVADASDTATDPKGAFGHSAIYVTAGPGKHAWVSAGSPVGFEGGIEGFVSQYAAQGRAVTMFQLQSTAEQDMSAYSFIRSNSSAGVNPEAGVRAQLDITENCTTAVVNVMKAAGLVAPDAFPARSLGGDRPMALKQSLAGGALANRVTLVITFRPVEDGNRFKLFQSPVYEPYFRLTEPVPKER